MFDLIPWHRRSRNDLAGFKSEMDNLFSRFFDPEMPFPRQQLDEGQWVPRIDVSEGEKDITIKAEIPGCDSKDIEVTLEGRVLTIRGDKKQEKEEKEKNYLRVERIHGTFLRMLELPADVDQKEVEARYKKGILKITLRKTTPKDVKKIEIKPS
jgi:HSP20 family protein